MAHAFTQDVPIDAQMHARIQAALGGEPLAGLLLHLVVTRSEGGLRYIDVWESKDACARAFDERIHPAVDGAFGGTRPGVEPVVNKLDVVAVMGLLEQARQP